ncbi:VirB8-like protein [Candidatus Deianiraea vastatrix]|uniref:VirB8-like protein n=2 Tax=Candidatus Deianiraea vastatrix TaxID=2163644 RepID=A0A5B8XDF9_9RICK|nr:VirB8-like protein [Candidatus Deianiraea vastatrix]
MKTNSVDTKMKSWYQDRYVVASVQRNILLLLTLLLSIGIFISLILVKYIYENKSVEPYLINVDKKTGSATIVESESVRSFTASEVVRESFVVKYIRAREGYKKETDSDDRNLVRVLSSKDAYSYYTTMENKQSTSDFLDSEKFRNPSIQIGIRSIAFTSPRSADLKIVKRIIIDGAQVRKKFFRIRLTFDFFDLDLPLEDRYLNPFGFQILGYDSSEEKVADGYDPEAEDLKNKTANSNKNSQQNVQQK